MEKEQKWEAKDKEKKKQKGEERKNREVFLDASGSGAVDYRTGEAGFYN